MERVDVGGLKIAFRTEGSGPPLLLLHGGVCDSRVWRNQLEDLSKNYTVLAWDAPGCGESADPPTSFSLSDYADCLASFLRALDVAKPHVVGHSWGSGLALELFRRHRSVPSSLILAGAYAGWAGSLAPEEVELRLEQALALARSLPGFDPRSIPGLFSERMPLARQDELIEIMSDIRATGTAIMARAFASADLRGVLGTVTIPTLLLCGLEDSRSPPRIARELHRDIPNSVLVELSGLGHEAFAEAPDVFNREVHRFLERLGSQMDL